MSAIPYSARSHASAQTSPARAIIPKAGLRDMLSVLFGVLLPTIAKGAIVRRPTVLALADRLNLDRRAIETMQRLRETYGSGPVLLGIPGRPIAVILQPEDVHRVLAESPDPFATATPEKTAALAHFEPKVSLISDGEDRADRRRYNEQALESHRPVHHMAEYFREVVRAEARQLQSRIHQHGGILDWNAFSDTWFRIVRRIIFGDQAKDDNHLSATMAKLRFAANWAYLRPQNKTRREQLLQQIKSYLDRAEPHSLAGLMSQIPTTARTAPEQQVTQWLFAFDPAGMTTFRSLALLATHPEQASLARNEIAHDEMPFLQATVLESLRLWPTTPLLLRQSKQETLWQNGAIPPDTELVIFTPFFHRDNQRFSYADHFYPELWTTKQRDQQDAALVPFSDGPGICPGRHLVLLLTTAMLSELPNNSNPRLLSSRKFIPGRPLPATLNHYRLKFQMRPA